MTLNEQIDTVSTLFGGEVSENDVVVYLSLAKSKAIARLYPYGDGTEDIPEKYDFDVCELAVRLLARKGGEGESSHNENGISRTYGTVDDEDILSRFVPFGKVFK